MHKVSHFRLIYVSAILIALSLPNVSVQLAEAQNTPAASVQHTHTQIHALKVTLLSTMLVGSTTGLGEWGFSALIEAHGHRVLLDTGAHPDTVLQNAQDLKIDSSDVKEVILTHNHWGHVSGFLMISAGCKVFVCDQFFQVSHILIGAHSSMLDESNVPIPVQIA
jgi:predicted metal-dependent RNase